MTVGTSSEETGPQPVARLDVAGASLPVYDLAAFNAADINRVKSFSTNFGTWLVPPPIAQVLAVEAGQQATLQWIHDTGELVLLGGVPESGEVEIDVDRAQGAADAVVPAWLGGVVGGVERDADGSVRERYRAEVMPAGSRVAVLAHVAHGPRVHELLWGWHRQHRHAEGWDWLVERLGRLSRDTQENNHVG